MAISASTWMPVGVAGLPQAITDTSTTQMAPTGTVVKCRDVSSNARGEAEFMYAKGVASTVAGDYCVIFPGGSAAIRTVARSKGQGGVAMSANVANQWGWYQIKGRAIVTAATVSADTTPYLTATDGSLDDTVVTGDVVYGARFTGATDTGQALIDLSYPHTQDTDNA